MAVVPLDTFFKRLTKEAAPSLKDYLNKPLVELSRGPNKGLRASAERWGTSPGEPFLQQLLFLRCPFHCQRRLVHLDGHAGALRPRWPRTPIAHGGGDHAADSHNGPGGHQWAGAGEQGAVGVG